MSARPLLLLFLLLGLLAACAPADSASLPTLAELPTLAPSDTSAPSATPQERPTLPPTFTPTFTATAAPSSTPTIVPSATPEPPEPTPTAEVLGPVATSNAQGVIVIGAGASPTPRFASQPYAEPVQLVEVIVPVRPIAAGMVLLPDMLRVYAFPAASVPPGAVQQTSEAFARIARVNIGCGEPIQARALTIDENDVGEVLADWPAAPCPLSGLEPLVAPYTYVEIVVAAQDLPAGQAISAAGLARAPWPAPLVPVDALLSIEEAQSRAPLSDILAGQPLRAAAFSSP